jgi:hypothetical protein
MITKNRVVIIVAFFMQVLTLYSQQKYALLIGIQNYPQDKNPGGSQIVLKGPKNDLVLVQEMLKEKGFTNANILFLQDEIATATNVLVEFEKLVKKVKQGDIVYIHYCGHGQQIADCNVDDYPNLKYVSNDEGDDGYDEAWALYNAPNSWFEGYDYSEHLVDDQLGYFLNELDKKIGVNGHLVFVSDACHSGTIDRGLNDNTRSGDRCIPKNYNNKSYIDKAVKKDIEENSNNSTKAIFYACTNNERASEIVVGDSSHYGNFTYSFVKAVMQLGKNASYENIYNLTGIKMIENFQNTYNNRNFNQTPEKYFEKPARFFLGNQNVKRDIRFKITSLSGDICIVNAGPIQGLAIGDKIGIYSNDSNSKLVACIGYVSKIISATKCQIKLDTLFSDKNYLKYHIRKILPSSSNIFSIKLDKSLSTKNKKKVKELLKLKPFVVIVDSKQPTYDLVVNQVNDDRIILVVGSSGNPFKKMPPLTLNDTIGQNSLLKYIDSANSIYQFLSFEFFDNLGIELKILESNIERDKYSINRQNRQQYDFDVINNSNSSYFVDSWYIDEFMNIEPLNEYFSTEISAKANKKWSLGIGCQPQFACGTSWVYVFFTKEDLDFYFADSLTDKRSVLNSNPKIIQQLDSSKKYIGDGIYLVKFRIDLE